MLPNSRRSPGAASQDRRHRIVAAREETLRRLRFEAASPSRCLWAEPPWVAGAELHHHRTGSQVHTALAAAPTCRVVKHVLYKTVMGTRAVRLDEESERILEEIRRETGMSVSAVLKQGLVATRDALRARRRAYALYASLDLGPGGYAVAPARDAKRHVRDAIRKKHGR